MAKFNYEDTLRKVIRERVEKFLTSAGISTPLEILKFERDKMIEGITDNTMGSLLGDIDTHIKAGVYTQIQLIRWAEAK